MRSTQTLQIAGAAQFSRELSFVSSELRYRLIENPSHISGAVTRISWHQLCHICKLTDITRKSLSYFWCHDQDLMALGWRINIKSPETSLNEIKAIEGKSTLLVQERANIDAELESFNLAEVRGKCKNIEVVIYKLVVLHYYVNRFMTC